MMNIFCIVGFDVQGSKSKREKYLEEHIKYLRQLKDRGKLFFAGPLLENSIACGSMLIVNFSNKADVETWFKNDPYYLSGIFKEYHIKEYLECIDQI